MATTNQVQSKQIILKDVELVGYCVLTKPSTKYMKEGSEGGGNFVAQLRIRKNDPQAKMLEDTISEMKADVKKAFNTKVVHTKCLKDSTDDYFEPYEELHNTDSLILTINGTCEKYVRSKALDSTDSRNKYIPQSIATAQSQNRVVSDDGDTVYVRPFNIITPRDGNTAFYNQSEDPAFIPAGVTVSVAFTLTPTQFQDVRYISAKFYNGSLIKVKDLTVADWEEIKQQQQSESGSRQTVMDYTEL